MFVFTVSGWFPAGATTSSPNSHRFHSPLRTVLARFTHTAPQQHTSQRTLTWFPHNTRWGQWKALQEQNELLKVQTPTFAPTIQSFEYYHSDFTGEIPDTLAVTSHPRRRRSVR